jgi:ribonuclease P protein subunit POP4
MSKKVKESHQTFENYAEELVFKEFEFQNPRQIYDSKVKGKVLLLEDAVPDYQAKKQQKLEKKLRKKKKTMNRNERKRLGLHEIPKESQTWDFFVPLHELWTSYMNEILTDTTNATMVHQKLIKADLHGAILTVVQSKCPSNIGISGIVAKDTERTFSLITRDNKLKGIGY